VCVCGVYVVCVCVCVCVALVVQHAMRMSQPYCHLWPAPLYHISSTLSTKDDFRMEKIIEYKRY